MNHIAKKGGLFGRRAEESAIALVLLRRQDERDVELTITRGQVEGIFGRVMKDVAACLA